MPAASSGTADCLDSSACLPLLWWWKCAFGIARRIAPRVKAREAEGERGRGNRSDTL